MSELVNAIIAVEKLEDELAEARRQLQIIRAEGRYDIALRPDDDTDPTLMDDIVVNNPTMFRAEQMDRNHWWVALYWDTEGQDELVFDVYAKRNPTRIEWRVRELPVGDFIYEDDVRPGRTRVSENESP